MNHRPNEVGVKLEANPRPEGDLCSQYPRVHFFNAFPYGPDTVIRFIDSEGYLPEGQKFSTGINTVYYMIWPGAYEGAALTPACRAHLIEFIREAVRGRDRVYLHISKGDGLFIDSDSEVRRKERTRGQEDGA